MAVPCVSIALGGTVTDAGITGGTDIGDWRYQVDDWSGLWGSIPIRGSHIPIGGRAGRTLVGSRLPDWRLLTLNLRSMPWDPTHGFTGGAGYTDEECGQIIENLLGMTGFYGDSDPLVIEWIVDTARSLYLEVFTVQAAQVSTQNAFRLLSQPLEASYPYWRQADIESDVISGAGSITNPGTAQVWDAVFVFAGDGSYTNNTTGQAIVVSGSTGPVTINALNGSVIMGGVDADGVAAYDNSQIMRLAKGVNSITTTVSVTTRWRPGYK